MKMAPDLNHFFKTAVELFVYLFLLPIMNR